MPQWFVSFEPSTRARTFMGSVKNKKVSYTKMLHCLRNDSYRKPSTKPVSSDAEQGLHPLVVEPADSVTIEPAVLPVGQDVDLLLDDIELNFGSKISLHIGSCSKSALVSLIKEMEGTLC